MRHNTISESGVVGADGKMRLPMDRLNEFFAQHKGNRVIVTIQAAEHGSTQAQIGYYYSYIIPEIVRALREQGTRMSEKQADKWLREQAAFIFEKTVPGTTVPLEVELERETGEIRMQKNVEMIGYTETRGIRDLSVAEMSDYLEWLKQFAAENLYVYIEDPKTI